MTGVCVVLTSKLRASVIESNNRGEIRSRAKVSGEVALICAFPAFSFAAMHVGARRGLSRGSTAPGTGIYEGTIDRNASSTLLSPRSRGCAAGCGDDMCRARA